MVTTDIYMLGAGIRHTLQLTIETVQALEASRVVFALHDHEGVIADLRRYCPDVRDLAPVYRGKSTRREAYAEIADMVVAEAAAGPTVALIVHGHPLLLVSATAMVFDSARESGMMVCALPAVSFLDTLLCDLEYEHGYALQVLEASTMLERSILPSPAMSLFVTQVATVLDYRVARGAPLAATLEPLVTHLTRVYPADHPCEMLLSSTDLLEGPSKVPVTLADLTSRDDLGLARRPTLYVPAR